MEYVEGQAARAAEMDAMHPMGRIAETADVAEAMLWLCSDTAGVPHRSHAGRRWRLRGGITRRRRARRRHELVAHQGRRLMSLQERKAGRLRGKIVVITGAASGLGAAAARRFAAEGAVLVLSDLQAERGKTVADELGAAFQRADVSCEEDVASLVDFAAERHGRIDCMVNNAGVLGAVGGIQSISQEHWRATHAVLLDSVFFGMKHAARVMVPRRDGCILTTASNAGIAAMGPHAYASAKHAVVGLTRSVATELAPFGVRVNAVAPGFVPTALTSFAAGSADAAREVSAQTSPLGRTIEPEDIAAGYVYLASDEGRNLTGHVLVIDGGVTSCPSTMPFYGDASSFVGAAG
jgi:NAD(P)-dependent dehydrogenase (short-subunit alcohol dehydrogenase family)